MLLCELEVPLGLTGSLCIISGLGLSCVLGGLWTPVYWKMLSLLLGQGPRAMWDSTVGGSGESPGFAPSLLPAMWHVPACPVIWPKLGLAEVSSIKILCFLVV